MKKIGLVALLLIAAFVIWSFHPAKRTINPPSVNPKTPEAEIDMTKWTWDHSDVVYLHPEAFGAPPSRDLLPREPPSWDLAKARDASIAVTIIQQRMKKGDLEEILQPISLKGSEFERARAIVGARVMKDNNVGPRPSKAVRRLIYQHMEHLTWAYHYVDPVWEEIVAKLTPEQQLELAKKIRAANPYTYRYPYP